jgi:polyisoprenoid-binding protein YceI
LTAAAVLGAALGVQAAPETYVVDPSHTFPSFRVAHLDISTQHGRFDRTRGNITLDREAASGSIAIEIDAASVSTGNPKLDAALRGEDFFDVERHPRIAFRSTQVQFDRGGLSRVEGDLTLLGVTRPVALKVERFGCTLKPFLVRTTCGADLSGAISRAAFGMKSYASFVGDEVRLDIQVEAVKEEKAVEPPSSGGG